MRRKCVIVDANVREVNGFPVYDLTLVNSHEMSEKHLRLGYTAERFNPNGPETIKHVSVVDKPDVNGNSQAKILFEKAGWTDDFDSIRNKTQSLLEKSGGKLVEFNDLKYKGLEIELGWRKSRDSDERVTPTFSAYTRNGDGDGGKSKITYCNNRLSIYDVADDIDFYTTGGENIGFNPDVLGNAWVDIENTVKPYEFDEKEFKSAWVQHQFSKAPLEVKSWEIREFEEVEGFTDYSLWVNDEYMCDVGTVQDGENSGLTFRDNGFENYLNGHFAYFEDGKMYYGQFLDDLKAYHELKDVRAFLFTHEEFEKITNKPLDSRPLEVASYENRLVQEADDSRPKNGDNGNYDYYEVLVNGKVVESFESGFHTTYSENSFHDEYNNIGLVAHNGLLYEFNTSSDSFELGELLYEKDAPINEFLVTNKRFNDMVAYYEQSELSLDKVNDINNPLYDRRNLLVSEMLEPENKKGVLDSHKYADADFDF